jgi:hypothetical protein
MAAKKVAYEPHPVHPARKAKLKALGYRIIDARFAPQGVAPYTRLDDGEDAPEIVEPELPPVPDALLSLGAFNAFDRNRDGRPGGSLPAAKRGLDDLKQRAQDLGIKIDRRWGRARLEKAIADAGGI